MEENTLATRNDWSIRESSKSLGTRATREGDFWLTPLPRTLGWDTPSRRHNGYSIVDYANQAAVLSKRLQFAFWVSYFDSQNLPPLKFFCAHICAKCFVVAVSEFITLDANDTGLEFPNIYLICLWNKIEKLCFKFYTTFCRPTKCS